MGASGQHCGSARMFLPPTSAWHFPAALPTSPSGLACVARQAIRCIARASRPCPCQAKPWSPQDRMVDFRLACPWSWGSLRKPLAYRKAAYSAWTSPAVLRPPHRQASGLITEFGTALSGQVRSRCLSTASRRCSVSHHTPRSRSQPQACEGYALRPAGPTAVTHNTLCRCITHFAAPR